MFRLKEEADAGGSLKPRRGFRRARFVLLALLGLVLVAAAVNVLAEAREKATTAPYGERIAVDGGSLNVMRYGNRQGTPVVLLSGLGTPAPGLDFAPLARELGGFDVIVVEGFGYGYSDMAAGPRTNEHISTELHQVLATLQVPQPYVLAGHSIAGFYLLDYANRYRTEVAAVVGIDASIPKPGDEPVAEPQPGINWTGILAATGLVRAVAAVAPAVVDPQSTAFTEDELRRMRMMSLWNFGNPAVADETARIATNAQALRGVVYPADLPVLVFVADEGSDRTAGKVAAAENLLRNVARHRVLTVQGGHYLHWTQAPLMAGTIREFLAATGPAPAG